MLRRRSTNSVTVHWSKDFVEHLRAVHFTLAAVSVGLILILSRTNSPALGQIRQIVELRRDWPPYYLVPPFMSGGEKVRNIDWTRDQYITARVTGRAGKSSRVRLVFPLPNWHRPDVGGSGPISVASVRFIRLSHFPTTLNEFRYWWNSLQTKYPFLYVYAVSTEGTVSSGLNKELSLMQLDPKASSAESAGGFDQSVQLDLTRPEGKWVFSGSDSHGNTYYLPVRGINNGSLDQSSIVNDINSRFVHPGQLKEGPFERSFSALAQETSGLEVENLEEIEKVLAERLAKRSEEFEAFGMKFPITQVTLWGTVILLAVQLYFFLYLKQLSGKLGPDDPGWDTPWICMDQSFLAQVIFFTTVIVLPVVAMLLLGGRASLRLTAGYWVPDSWHLLVKVKDWEWAVRLKIATYLLASIAALVLGIASWLFRPRLSLRTEQHCPAQLFE